MSEIPKQELDELFREGAGMQTFEYNESAWQKMETKLDDDDRKRRAFILWFAVGLGLVLAIAAGLWSYNNTEVHTPTDIKYVQQNENPKPSLDKHQEIQTSEPIVEASSDNDKNPIDDKNPTETIVVATQSPIALATAALTDDINSTTYTVRKDQSDIEKNYFESNQVSYPSANETIDLSKVIQSTIDDTASNIITSTPSRVALSPLDHIERLENNELPTRNREVANSQRKVIIGVDDASELDEPSTLSSSLSYSLFVGSEWSSIGLDGPHKKGYKLGAKIGYQWSDRLEVSTGLFVSQKKFNGSGSEFTITEGWIDNIMPMAMNAKCNIIEIPLDLSYHFSGVGNTGFVAGVGLRSFMLHSEWYGFEYNPLQYKPGLVEERVMENRNQNWVGSIELSMGYTKQIGNQLSMQIVPYLQIPVTGIGEGKVNLYSAGIQFSTRFDGR